MGDFHPDSVVRLVQATLTVGQTATLDVDTGEVLSPARPIQVMLEYEIVLPSGAALRRTVHASAEHERLQDHHAQFQQLLEHLASFARVHEGFESPAHTNEPEAAASLTNLVGSLPSEPEANASQSNLLLTSGPRAFERVRPALAANLAVPGAANAGPTHAAASKPTKAPKKRRGRAAAQK